MSVHAAEFVPYVPSSAMPCEPLAEPSAKLLTKPVAPTRAPLAEITNILNGCDDQGKINSKPHGSAQPVTDNLNIGTRLDVTATHKETALCAASDVRKAALPDAAMRDTTMVDACET